MSLMDRVKSQVKVQAGQLGEKAQQAGQAGQAKIAEFQAKKKADAMLLELGVITYREKTGHADPNDGSRADELISMLKSHEAEYGPISVRSANATFDESTE
jgi:hypothetical protein